MRVINCTTKKVYEVGLFENPCWEGALKIRVLELPLVFGNLGTDVGFLEMWEGLDRVGVGCCSFDEDALLFFDLDPDVPLEDLLCTPLVALEIMIQASRRFQADWEPDKIEA